MSFAWRVASQKACTGPHLLGALLVLQYSWSIQSGIYLSNAWGWETCNVTAWDVISLSLVVVSMLFLVYVITNKIMHLHLWFWTPQPSTIQVASIQFYIYCNAGSFECVSSPWDPGTMHYGSPIWVCAIDRMKISGMWQFHNRFVAYRRYELPSSHSHACRAVYKIQLMHSLNFAPRANHAYH